MSAHLTTSLPKPCACQGKTCSGTITRRPFFEFVIHDDGRTDRVYADGIDCLIHFLTKVDGTAQTIAFQEARTARVEDYRRAGRR